MRSRIRVSTLALFSLLATGCSETSVEGRGDPNSGSRIDVGPVPDGTTSFVDDAGTDNQRDAGALDDDTIQANLPDGVARPDGDVDCGAIPNELSGQTLLCDLDTGSFWSLEGEALSGPYAGTQLSTPRVITSFWFAWSTFYGGSDIWNRDENNSATALGWQGGPVDGGTCLVPCNEIRQACGGGKDCIPAIDDAIAIWEPGDADLAFMNDTDLVVGVVMDGVVRAYPHNVMWTHEIFNDHIGDHNFTVTLCPLTGSGIVFDGGSGDVSTFGVSGNLYNANLTMYDRNTDSWWSQMLGASITGTRRGEVLQTLPATHSTWGRWKELHPDTVLMGPANYNSSLDGRYSGYPYGAYRTNTSTWQALSPAYDDTFHAKDFTVGVIAEDGSEKAYVASEMAQFGSQVVINDTLGSDRIVVFYEHASELGRVFNREVNGLVLNFVVAE